MLTHSTSRAFQCTKCQKSFIDQRTLDRHSKIHIGTWTIFIDTFAPFTFDLLVFLLRLFLIIGKWTKIADDNFATFARLVLSVLRVI